MNCQKCGNEIAPGTKFCEQCGTNVENQQAIIFCSNCGVQNKDGGAFCENCGQPLNKQVSPNMGQQQTQYVAQQPIQQEPSNSNKGLLLGLGIVSLLIVMLAGGWFFFGREWLKNKNKDDNTIASEAVEDSTDEKAASDAATDSEGGANTPAVEEVARQQVNLSISHVDVSNFPEIKCYVHVEDQYGVTIKEVKAENFEIWETLSDGTRKKVTLEQVLEAGDSAGMSINLVMDRSGSMEDYGYIYDAQSAANSLVTEIKKNDRDFVSITAFEDYVSVLEDFTKNYDTLHSTINALSPGGGTAFYDALYSALLQTSEREGAKCIIAFTDGLDNKSRKTYNEVVELSKQTSIPIYIIGLGQDFSAVDLEKLATDTMGHYYAIQGGDVEVLLEQIYQDIYQNQLEQYVFTCMSESNQAEEAFRTIEIDCVATSEMEGSAQREYVPKPEIVNKFLAEEGVHRYDIIVEDATWTEAQAECERRGGYLVRINTDEEYKAILKQIEKEVDGRKQFFIGAARNPNYEEYYWVYEDGEFGTERINNNPKYDDYWLAGEPTYTDSGSGMMETRMVLLQPAGSDEWVWNDIPDNLIAARETISTKMGYICEYED